MGKLNVCRREKPAQPHTAGLLVLTPVRRPCLCSGTKLMFCKDWVQAETPLQLKVPHCNLLLWVLSHPVTWDFPSPHAVPRRQEAGKVAGLT